MRPASEALPLTEPFEDGSGTRVQVFIDAGGQLYVALRRVGEPNDVLLSVTDLAAVASALERAQDRSKSSRH